MIHLTDSVHALVHAVLNDPSRKWTVQGLGMLRTYLTKKVRLHIWHHDLIYKDRPSAIHNHPWDFASTVVCGGLVNIVYKARPARTLDGWVVKYHRASIQCGANPTRGPELDETPMILSGEAHPVREGETYFMNAVDLHKTEISYSGTVTLVSRGFRGSNHDTADVYYPAEHDWVSAEPREATPEEITLAVDSAKRLLRGK